MNRNRLETGLALLGIVTVGAQLFSEAIAGLDLVYAGAALRHVAQNPEAANIATTLLDAANYHLNLAQDLIPASAAEVIALAGVKVFYRDRKPSYRAPSHRLHLVK